MTASSRFKSFYLTVGGESLGSDSSQEGKDCQWTSGEERQTEKDLSRPLPGHGKRFIIHLEPIGLIEKRPGFRSRRRDVF